MRFLSVMLVLIITGLLMVPCSDMANNCGDSLQAKAESSHNHKQDLDDTCTPFCGCSCCGITMAAFHFYSHDLAAPIHFFSIKFEFPSDFNFLSQDTASVWQPPKLIIA